MVSSFKKLPNKKFSYYDIEKYTDFFCVPVNFIYPYYRYAIFNFILLVHCSLRIVLILGAQNYE